MLLAIALLFRFKKETLGFNGNNHAQAVLLSTVTDSGNSPLSLKTHLPGVVRGMSTRVSEQDRKSWRDVLPSTPLVTSAPEFIFQNIFK